MSRDSIIDRFLVSSQKNAGKPAAWYERRGTWRYLNWANYAQKCRLFAGALIARGLQPGAHVAILAANSPNWVMAHLGAMMARSVPVGVYLTNAADEVGYILGHCEAAVLVAEDYAQWDKLRDMPGEGSNLKCIVMLQDIDLVDDERAISFKDFLEEGRAHLDEVNQRVEAIKMDEVAALIYTSGTTADPKGVMLTHQNLAFTANATVKLVGDLADDDCVVSYLPLSHIAEQMFTVYLAATFAYPVWFCRDFRRLRDTLAIARPTVFFGVPRVWEKLKARIEARLDEEGAAKTRVIDWARQTGLRIGYHQLAHGEVHGAMRVKYEVAQRTVFKKVKEAIGFDRLRVGLSSAAPIGMEVLEFFLSLDIPILEIYGQTEACGPTTANRPTPGQAKLGTVGLPLPDVQIKLADDGEVLARGGNIFKGYYKDEEATARALTDGWLSSGDLGSIDEGGFLRITGRKKELIITAGGKNISPAKVENLLRNIPAVSHAVLIGDGRKYLSALLTVDAKQAATLAAARGWPQEPDELVEAPEFKQYIAAKIDAINAKLSQASTVKKWQILAQEFSIKSGELTPSMKVKRRVIDRKYAQIIDALYAEDASTD